MILYKNVKNLIKLSKTLKIIQKIFLILCKFLIINNDFSNCLFYLEKCIEISFKEIFIRVDVNKGINEDYNKIKKKILNKIFFVINLIFLYRGIIYEKKGLIKYSIESYKQCKYFSNVFKNNNINIIKLNNNLKNRSIECFECLNYINNKIEYYINNINNKENSNNNSKIFDNKNKKKSNNNNITNNSFNIEENSNDEKYKNLINIIENLKINEIDTVNDFYNKSYNYNSKEYNLNNLRLIDAYLSKDFKNIINKMDKINLYDLDYKTREIVQKQYSQRHFNFTYRNINLSKSNINKINNNKNSLKKIRINNSNSPILNSYLNSKLKNRIFNNFYNNNNNIYKSLIINNKSLSLSSSPKKKINKKKDKNKKFSEEFNKKFLNKLNYINELSDREIKFQKKLLLLKKSSSNSSISSFNLKSFNKFLVQKDAKNTFNKLIIMLNPINNNNYEIKRNFLNDDLNNKKNFSLQNSIVKSLSEKAIINYNKEIERQNEKKNQGKVDTIENESIKENNKKTDLVLSKNLENIEKLKEKKILKRKKLMRNYSFLKKYKSSNINMYNKYSNKLGNNNNNFDNKLIFTKSMNKYFKKTGSISMEFDENFKTLKMFNQSVIINDDNNIKKIKYKKNTNII